MENYKDSSRNSSDLGERLFRARDYTPLPFLLLLVIFERPHIATVTVGCLLVFLGELIRIYSVAFIGGISRTRKGSLGERLVDDGAFRYVRNPLYIGNFFILLGVSVFGGVPWLVILSVLFFVVQYHLIVQYEEKILEDKFQDEFRSYKLRVPPWIPTRLPQLDDMEWPTSFSSALRSEKRTLTAILAVLFLLVLCS